MLEIFLVALRLGCTSFGGPVAHLAFFRKEYVEKRRWLDEVHYADLVALCQFLPGPASSQTSFGIGYLQRGLAGGLAAWLGFTLPSALLMIAFALGVTALGDLGAAGWLKGLKAAAVAVVAQAVWAMSKTLCPDWPRRVLTLAAAALLLWLPFAWSQIAVIGAGAIAGLAFLRNPAAHRENAEERKHGKSDSALPSFRVSAICLVLFFGLLLGLPVLAGLSNRPALDLFDRFYRAGSLVFGGGHVVLPLLEREVVAPGWVTPNQFLAGYGAAQAVPGPLFSLAAYLGAVTTHGPGGISGGCWALLAVFLPALLLVAGALPFWQTLRGRPAAQAAMRGANAAVVGVLLAALIHPVGTLGLVDARSTALAVATFVLLQRTRVPVWAVIGGAALAGAAFM
ncbi:putative chromate transport protein [Lacunisphaera limnophila]|uniref:Putative chromate transport protein n=1 Tax=Lacunisphaera limnophila TaxID=1838286 RepID=A0A1D8ARL8_9BACT|nr:putative chromate transport protein [Lacunisphaera limnophila]